MFPHASHITGRSTSSSSQTRNFAEEHAFTRAPTREEDPHPPKEAPVTGDQIQCEQPASPAF